VPLPKLPDEEKLCEPLVGWDKIRTYYIKNSIKFCKIIFYWGSRKTYGVQSGISKIFNCFGPLRARGFYPHNFITDEKTTL